MFPNVYQYQAYPNYQNCYFPIFWIPNAPLNFNIQDASSDKNEQIHKQFEDKRKENETEHMISFNEKKLTFQEKKSCSMEETEKLSLKKKPKAKPTFPKNEGKKDQNSFRNILPNIVHQLVIFVQKKSKSKKMVESILSKSEVDQNCSVNRFYLYQRLIKQKTSHYLNEDILNEYKMIQEIKCQIFSLEQQKEYLRISRILVKYFIKNFMRTSVLTSTRMKQQIKNGHLSLLRFLQDRINEIYSQ